MLLPITNSGQPESFLTRQCHCAQRGYHKTRKVSHPYIDISTIFSGFSTGTALSLINTKSISDLGEAFFTPFAGVVIGAGLGALKRLACRATILNSNQALETHPLTLFFLESIVMGGLFGLTLTGINTLIWQNKNEIKELGGLVTGMITGLVLATLTVLNQRIEKSRRDIEINEALTRSTHDVHENNQALLSPINAPFGKEAWETYFGEIGEVPSLPKNIETILQSPCPFWGEKKVEETHLLVFIPAVVNQVAFTLNSLEKLIDHPQNSALVTRYRSYFEAIKSELGDQSSPSSYWVLMTKAAIPESLGKTYHNQRQIMEEQGSYKLPSVLEAATVILTHYVKTGERLYKDSTYTRSRERVTDNQHPVAIGGFSLDGLSINYGSHHGDRGAAGLRTFLVSKEG